MLECDPAPLERADQIIDLIGDERHGRRLVRPGIRRAVYEQCRRSALEGQHLIILHDLGQPERTLVEVLRLFEIPDGDSRNCIVIAEHTALSFSGCSRTREQAAIHLCCWARAIWTDLDAISAGHSYFNALIGSTRD